ncbi:MAG: hypothetical protein JXQ90_02120 [Cyclobacteriaceae bacterium]
MKKTILKVSSLIMAFQVLMVSFASAAPKMNSYESEDYNLAIDSFESDFAELDELEAFIGESNLTYEELAEIENLDFDLNSVAAVNSISSTMAFSFGDMDWVAFLWGFFCWPIGIFTVLLNDDKGSDSRISFWIGLATAVVLGNGVFFGVR